MPSLDDLTALRRSDPSGMLDLVVRFPEMGQEAWREALTLRLPATGEVTSIVVLGMGGSGVGGDLLAALAAPLLPAPVIVVKGYDLPAFVGPQTLVFACSYSGNTEETLAACAQARGAPAPLIIITSGGALGEQAAAHGDPVIRIPPGLPPRAALPYLFLPMVCALRRFSHLGELSGQWAEARTVLQGMVEELRPEMPADRNQAKQVAARLAGHLPAIYASTPWLAPAAYRFKCQLNENGKSLALSNAFPELSHNETVGYQETSLVAQLAVVLLHDPFAEPRDTQRVAVTQQVVLHAAASIDEIPTRGTSPLARLLSLVLFGDFTSVYFALVRGIDPTPVEPIERVKGLLRGGSEHEKGPDSQR